jgi:hypothetical protein
LRELLDKADCHHGFSLAGTASDPEQANIILILPKAILRILKNPFNSLKKQLILALLELIFDDKWIRALQSLQIRWVHRSIIVGDYLSA